MQKNLYRGGERQDAKGDERTWSEVMEFMVFMSKLPKNKYNEYTRI